MSSSCGRTACSSGGLNGIGTSGAVRRRIGASRSSNASSAISAATSAPTPQERVASWATSTLPVLRTLARIASVSSGQRRAQVDDLDVLAQLLRGLQRQVDARAVGDHVSSPPSRATAASPIGTV